MHRRADTRGRAGRPSGTSCTRLGSTRLGSRGDTTRSCYAGAICKPQDRPARWKVLRLRQEVPPTLDTQEELGGDSEAVNTCEDQC